MKAIIIARVSTEEQREAGNSLPAQVARLERYCHNKDFEIIQTSSFDESAYKKEREEFDTIIDSVLAQKEKVALCFDKVDRLSRNVFDKRIGMLYDKAVNGDLEIHFVSDGQILNDRISATEKFQFSISLGLAKYYSDAISDNVKRAQEQKIRRGEWLSKAYFGYKNIRIGDKAEIVVVEHDAHIVKQVFEWYATGAYSMLTLCQKVKKEFGLSWPKGSMGKLLNNPFYHGTMVNKGKHNPHCYQTIITKSLFDQVQAIKEGFKKKPFKYAGLPFHYRGLIRCADCGLSISPERHKGYAYYHCTEYKGKHGAKWIREEAITEQLATVFKSIQMPKEMLEQTLETLSEVHKNKIKFHTDHFDKVTKEQKKLSKMMDALYLDRLQGKINDEQYDRFYEKFVQQKEETTAQINHLQEAENNYYLTAKYILNLADRAYDLFMSSEVEEKRQLIKLVLQNVKMDGKKIVYDVQKPFDLMIEASDSHLWRG